MLQILTFWYKGLLSTEEAVKRLPPEEIPYSILCGDEGDIDDFLFNLFRYYDR